MLTQEMRNFEYHSRGELQAEQIINKAFAKSTRWERFMEKVSLVRQNIVRVLPNPPSSAFKSSDMRVFYALGGFSNRGFICIVPKGIDPIENNWGK